MNCDSLNIDNGCYEAHFTSLAATQECMNVCTESMEYNFQLFKKKYYRRRFWVPSDPLLYHKIWNIVIFDQHT